MTKNIYLVMADDAAVEHVIQLYGPTKIPITMQYLLNFDMKGNDTAKSEALESMKARMETSGEVQSCYVEYREAYAQEFYGVYGGIFLPWNFCRILIPDGDGPDHLLQTNF